jgi:tetratricopeptide (TPR) repeat protein
MIFAAGPVRGSGAGAGSFFLRLTRIAVFGSLLAGCQHQTGQLSPLGPAPPPRPLFEKDVSQLIVGERLLAQNQDEAALKAFNASMIEEGVSHDALVGAAAANFRLGRLNLARRLLIRAAERYPNSAQVRNNLGVVHYQLGDLANARAEFNAAYALKSGLSEEIERNMGMLAIAEERAAKEDVEVEDGGYYVVPQGGGVFKLVKAEGAS